MKSEYVIQTNERERERERGFPGFPIIAPGFPRKVSRSQKQEQENYGVYSTCVKVSRQAF